MKHNILLAFSFSRRDFLQRYVGTGLGQLWYIISPMITILIYTIIFSDFMKMKLNVANNTYSYSVYIVPGILSWLSFSKTFTMLSNLVAQKTNFIKKINVPMYVFYLSIAITEFVLFLFSMSLGVLFLYIIHYHIDFTFLWLIPIMILQSIFVFSFGVIVSLFVPFFKDLKEVIPVVMQLWFWMTPIIYTKKMLENKYPFILTFNPFYHFVHLYQDIFLYSKAPSLHEILIITSISGVTFLIATYLYKKLISEIKDII